MPTTLRSHAKINLGLYIGAPRADGFHSLVTVYQTLEIHDLVTVSARPAAVTSIRLTSNDDRVPTDERNTAWKMILLALEELRVTAEVSIHIDKRLPVQGGLGAGSANAVAALVGLERELVSEPDSAPRSQNRDLGHPANAVAAMIGLENELCDFPVPKILNWVAQHREWPAKRNEIAARVGSDVPLFLIGGTVMGLDRGQQVSPLPDLEAIWCVVATPNVAVSTPRAFRDWDTLCAERGLTQEASDGKLKRLSQAYASAFAGGQLAGSSGVFSAGEDLAGTQRSALVRTGILSWIENDFEQVVFRQHPSLAEIKRVLAAAGTPEAALYASLSGSGSALYGLYANENDAQAAQRRIQEELGVAGTVTRTLPRAEYWRGMLVQNRE